MTKKEFILETCKEIGKGGLHEDVIECLIYIMHVSFCPIPKDNAALLAKMLYLLKEYGIELEGDNIVNCCNVRECTNYMHITVFFDREDK